MIHTRRAMAGAESVKLVPTRPGDAAWPPHQWYGRLAILPPVCIHCEMCAPEVLLDQPETGGAGPCLMRVARRGAIK